MVTPEEIRAYAMALPGVEQGPPVPAARRVASFKVQGKSFLGIEKGDRWMTASLGAADADELRRRHPEAYEEIWRSGQRFMGLRVDLAMVSAQEARGVIERSWRHAAPRGLVAAYDARD